MAGPTFTVVIPTCNRPDFLAACLAALAPGVQTVPADNYAVLVTDDSASGATKQVVENRFPWASWFAGPRRGPAINRNYGAAQATGGWIIFLDDDCIPKPDLLKAYQAALKPGIRVYEGKITCEGWRNDPLETAPLNETGGWLWSCNMMVERELFARIGGFDERFPFAGGEDVEFRERLVLLSEPSKWVPEAVVDHPPRPRNLFVKAARREESQIPLLLLHGERNPYRRVVPMTMKQGLRTLARTRFSRKWVIAASSLVVQSVAILVFLPAWRRRYGFTYEHPVRVGPSEPA